MDKKILIVDDEIQVLKALMRTFMDSEYDIYTAESGMQALEIMDKEAFDMVISDMRMPHMDGYELLCRVKEKFPDAIRIILSGYSDENVVFNALQRNIAKLYVLKPWENSKLLKLVDNIFETEELLRNSNLLTMINNIEELPTIKTNYQRILTGIDGDMDISDISKLIEQDQSVATKLLHIANSAYYGVRTGSVNQAVRYLGLSNVRNLIVSTSIIDSMSTLSIPNSLIQDLWNHAYITNKILILLYEVFLNKKLPETCMSAGLLHNIGIVLLMYRYKGKYLQCMRNLEKTKGSLIEEERRAFGVDHHETGGYLLKWWALPFPIVEVALYHHTPLSDSIINKELLCGVHIAERYASIALKKIPNSGFVEETFRLLGIDKVEFEEKISKM